MRRIRYLRRNHSEAAPTRHVVAAAISCVDDTFNGGNCRILQPLRIGHTAIMRRDGRTQKVATSSFAYPCDFWAHIKSLLRPKHATWLWVFRAADFIRLTGFDELLDHGEWQLHRHVWENRPHITIAHCGAGKLTIVDIRNWLFCDAAALCELLGEPVPTLIVDGNDSVAVLEFLGGWLRTCYRAVEGILDFHRDMKLGAMRTTIGAQALALYRHRYAVPFAFDEHCVLKKDMSLIKDKERIYPIPHNDTDALDTEVAAVAGGLFAQRIRGRVAGNIHVLDIQSAYASAMAENLMPAKLLGVMDSPSVPHLAETVGEYPCVAYVRLDSPDREFPVRLPKEQYERYRNLAPNCVGEYGMDKVPAIMATGRYWTALAGPELAAALAKDYVKACDRCYYYAGCNLFSNYVSELWQARQLFAKSGSALDEALSKQLLAALWGKFNQHSPRWIDNADIECTERWGLFIGEDPYTGWYGPCRGVAGKTQMRIAWDLSPHSFPAISATVCAAVRCKVQMLAEIAGLGNVYYIAADCLHVTDQGRLNLHKAGWIRPGEYGFLKVKSTLHWAYYHAPMAWWTNDIRKVSGVPIDAVNLGRNRYEFWESQPLQNVIYEGPGTGLRQNRIVLDINEWEPRGSVSRSGWVQPLYLDLLTKKG